MEKEYPRYEFDVMFQVGGKVITFHSFEKNMGLDRVVRVLELLKGSTLHEYNHSLYYVNKGMLLVKREYDEQLAKILPAYFNVSYALHFRYFNDYEERFVVDQDNTPGL